MASLSATIVLVLIVTVLKAQTKPVSIAGQCSAEVVENQSLSCSTDEPCPLFLELASVERVASRTLVTGNLHTGSQTLESVLLVSDDGGRTWTEPMTRIAGAVLDQIQF